MKYELLNSKINRQGRIFSDVTRTINTPDGTIVRDVISKNPVVGVIVYHRAKEVFMLCQEFRVGPMDLEYGFPAGIVDAGETPFEAAIREVQEETGYKVDSIEALGEAYSSSGFSDELMHFFYAEVTGEPAAQQLDKDENIKLCQFNHDQLGELFMKNQIGAQGHAAYLKLLLKKKGQFHMSYAPGWLM